MSTDEQNWLMQGFYLDHWLIDPAHGRFETSGHRIHIEPKVMDVLLCLAASHGEVVSRADILDEVWHDLVVSEEVLTRCISELRTALNDTNRERRFIRTVPKRGYSLIIEPTPLADKSSAPTDQASTEQPATQIPESPPTQEQATHHAKPSDTAAKQPKTTFQRWIGQESLIALALVILFLVYKWGAGELTNSEVNAAQPLLAADNLNSANQPDQRLDVAVLPFANISADSNDDYFSIGLAEDIRNKLIRTDGLRVAARTSSEVFLGQALPIGEIGEALNTRTVIEGTVRMDESRIRLTVQLSDVDDGHPVWAETYERDRVDVFALQEEIATKVVQQLAPALTSTNNTSGAEFEPNNIQAYDNYLLGRFQWNKRTPEALERAQVYFQRAIDLDPNYAAAYAGMADSILVSKDYAVDEEGTFPAEITQRVEALINKALTLNPQDSEANASRGLLAQLQSDHDAADAYFQRALTLNPNNSMALMWLGNLKMKQNYPNQAYKSFKSALKLDPLHPAIQTNYLSALLQMGKTDEILVSAPYFYSVTNQQVSLKYQFAAWLDIGQLSRALEFIQAQEFDGHLREYMKLGSVYALTALKRFEEANTLLDSIEITAAILPTYYEFKTKLVVAQRDSQALALLLDTVAPLFEEDSFKPCDQSYLWYYKGVLAWNNEDTSVAEAAFFNALQASQKYCHDLVGMNVESLAYLIKTANYREDSTLAGQRYQMAMDIIAEAKRRGFNDTGVLINELKLYVANNDLISAKTLLADMQEQGKNLYGWMTMEPIFDPVIDQLFQAQPGHKLHLLKEAYLQDQSKGVAIDSVVLES